MLRKSTVLVQFVCVKHVHPICIHFQALTCKNLFCTPDVLYSWDTFKEWCITSFSVHNHERHALTQLENLRQTGSVAEYKAAHNVLAAQTNLPMQLRIHWWEKGLKEHIRSQVKVDPVTHTEYTDIDTAQSAACALDAHLDSSSAAAARKRSPSSASARVEPRAQRARHDYVPRTPEKVAKWQGDSAENFSCDTEGRLADSLPEFFKSWTANLEVSKTNGKPLLPNDLLKSGSLPSNTCFYKGCMKPGHRWDHCPKLAMHVAKNPTLRDF